VTSTQPIESAPGSPAAKPEAAKPKRRAIRKVLVFAAVFIVGVLVGSVGGEEPQVVERTVEVPAAGDADLAAALEVAEGERDEAQALAEGLQGQVEALNAQLEAASEAGVDAAEAEAETPAEPAAGSYTAGQYEFADVQVREDFGDFAAEVAAHARLLGKELA
jgi:hypothetical protein